jgi:signal transduction histidine kinase
MRFELTHPKMEGEAVEMPPPDQLTAAHLTWPRWVVVGSAAFATLLATLDFFLVSEPMNRALLAVLLAFTVAPWWCWVAGIELPPLPHALWVLTGIGLLAVGGQALGVVDFEAVDSGEVIFMLLVFLVGQVATIASSQEAALVTAAALAIVLARDLIDTEPASWLYWWIGIGFGAFGGKVAQQSRLRVLQMEATQALLAQQAATEERQRIAREVHDVIAHSLSVAMLHLTAARLAVNRQDMGAAAEALEEAERAGRQSLKEIRATMGLLRGSGPGSDGTDAPQPTAADVVELVADYRMAGLEVELQADGDLSGIPGPVGLAAYRIVQESLANVAKHTPGAAASVALLNGVELAVRVDSRGGTPQPSRGGGAGIAGMRERVEALGGEFQAGPTGDGWTVVARLPLPPSP